MKLLSIIIPSANEPFLNKTIEDLLIKADEEIEIIVSLDKHWPSPILGDERVKYVHSGNSRGMRSTINSGVAIAQGDFLMKADAHCMFDQGFDSVLKKNCEKNWVVVPRRKRLDPYKWELTELNKPPVDYEYLSFPDNPHDFGGASLHGRKWNQRTVERMDKEEFMIDDLMSAQGSCFFMHRDYFHELELEDEENYGTFTQEFQEIGLKCWLSGGRVVVNKNTWYAHWHKGKTPEGKTQRGYFLDVKQLQKGARYINKWIDNAAWHKQTLPFSSMIEKFWPIPDWPSDWKEKLWKDKGEPLIVTR